MRCISIAFLSASILYLLAFFLDSVVDVYKRQGFNSPNFVFLMSGQSCYSPRVAGCFSTSGSFWVGDYSQQFPDRYDNPDWKRPDLIVIWGNNPIVSNSDGLYGHWVVDCLKICLLYTSRCV